MEKRDSMHFLYTPLQTLFSELKSSSQGLTTIQVRKRRKQYGPNAFDTISRVTLLRIFYLRFQNPLIILLLIAAIISAVVHDIHSAILITLMVLLSISIDAVQEFRASNAAETLRQSVALSPLVLRDQQFVRRPIEDLVPGDIVCLSAGDLVPADGRLLEAKDLYVNQSLLTGESFPVEKRAQEFCQSDESITNATNVVFMGTSILSGTAQYIVCLTGKNTALGGIASQLSTHVPPSAFEMGMRQFSLLLMRLILVLILFVILANLFYDRPWFETLLFALALGVGLAPEFLPMVISITLAKGAVRMAQKNVIVKRLSSIHDFGSMDILCCDKTGTLTEAKIQLAQHLDLKGEKNDHVLQIAYLNSYFETGIKSPLDGAILEYRHLTQENWKKIDEIPFDFERRRISVLVDNGKKRLLLVKGAPEEILAISTHYEDEPQTITPKHLCVNERKKIQNQFNDLSQQGFRVLGIAWREVPRNHSHAVIHDESGLTFAGFVTFFDPPKASASEALKKLQENSVKLKIITGDNELVTQHLCHQINIPIEGLLIGYDIDTMDDSALSDKIEKVNLFCRVNPAQKNRIITLLKSKGHVVGYMGDGINDAPSLHSANLAISVDSGVDVAKQAADIILLKQDLTVIYEGVIEGRKTYGNIMKYIMMMTSSNFGNMISMAGAAIFLPFLPMLPTQILLNNFLYDLSEIAIPLDNVDKNILEKPNRWKISFIRKFMFIMGPISSVFDFLTFGILLYVLKASEVLFHTGWFVESLATQILVIFIIRTRLSPFKSRPHPTLVISSIGLASLGIIIPYTQLGTYFKFTPLPTTFFIILGMLCVLYLILAEVGKRIFYRYSCN